MKQFDLRMLTGILPFLLAAPAVALAQPTPSTQAETNAALSPSAAAFSPPQLDQMLAPIALYPVPLLTELLMAATFPQQIIDAEKWLQDPNNAALTGDALVAALQPLPWDPSVKSLAAFPQIIGMMNNHFDWTQALGLPSPISRPRRWRRSSSCVSARSPRASSNRRRSSGSRARAQMS
jgi:hypothetical protein